MFTKIVKLNRRLFYYLFALFEERELTLIPVEQTSAEEVTYYFFTSMDYQLTKTSDNDIILQVLIELDIYTLSCESTLAQSN